MPKEAKSKSINIAKKWNQWYIKTDSKLLFFDYQQYKLGNQKEGGTEYTPETIEHR